MALTYGKKLNVVLNKKKTINLFGVLLQRKSFQDVLSAAYCSSSAQSSREKLSRAMKSYLEKVQKYDEFMKEQLQEFNRGKQFLAGMMGRKSEMTQKDIDEAIEYLFPSALFVPKSRPLMKSPEEIYAKQKSAVFDNSGRPFHFLFYTSKMNYSQCLHDAAAKLEELNLCIYRKEIPPKPLFLLGGRWISQIELQEKLMEKLYDIEYEKFIEVFKTLSQHPFALSAEAFIRQFWIPDKITSCAQIPKAVVTEDGTEVVTIERAKKKLCLAKVKVSRPGSGQIRINNLGIDFFHNLQCRRQVIYPLLLTEMLDKVDVEATVEGEGDSSQALAIRWGIAQALQAFLSKEKILELKLAGLLQPDIRRRERKKPGQEGARRRYTWLKR